MPDQTERLIPSTLFVDVYELTMADVHLRNGLADKPATFSLYFRGYGHNRGYYLVAGIDTALAWLENLSFNNADIKLMGDLGILSDDLLQHLADFTFTGSVHAVREGDIVFDSEPVLEVTAPVIQAQFAETALLNTIMTATMFATKAARIVQAANGKPIIDMGARRTHGSNAALTAARSAYIAGFNAASLLEASTIGVPTTGTMAHSYIQAMPDEITAFRRYADRYPKGATLLVDTYDSVQGVEHAITTAHELRATDGHIRAIRIDSGDLGALATTAREMLDKAGLHDVQIVASGGLDEYAIQELEAQGAPIDAFGVGTKYGTSADAPYIEAVYKLVEFGGQPVSKQSEGKRTLPYAKQVHRTFDDYGMMQHDTITRRDEPPTNRDATVPLLREAMHAGKRIKGREPIPAIRERVASTIATMPQQYRQLQNPARYPVHISNSLTDRLPT